MGVLHKKQNSLKRLEIFFGHIQNESTAKSLMDIRENMFLLSHWSNFFFKKKKPLLHDLENLLEN